MSRATKPMKLHIRGSVVSVHFRTVADEEYFKRCWVQGANTSSVIIAPLTNSGFSRSIRFRTASVDAVEAPSW